MDDSQRALECLIILAWENLNFIQRSHDGVLLNKHRLFPSFDRVCDCVSQQVDFGAAQSSNNPTSASLGEDSDDVKQAVT